MTRSQVIVMTVKGEYPKFSRAALSLASRSYETGVTLTPRARELKNAAERATTPHKRTLPKRVKSIKFQCRMRENDARRVKNEMARHGLETTQELLETLLLEWVEKAEKDPLGATNAERVKGEEKISKCPLPSENITNETGGQE
jgi:hypothetical protein